MSDRNIWEARAQNNLYIILESYTVHCELEAKRRMSHGESYERQEMKITLSLPGHDLIDSQKELSVVGLNKSTMTLFVIQDGSKSDIVISIPLGDIGSIGFGFGDKLFREMIIERVASDLPR